MPQGTRHRTGNAPRVALEATRLDANGAAGSDRSRNRWVGLVGTVRERGEAGRTPTAERLSPTTPVAIVLAAGQGSRVGAGRPKQLLDLWGAPVLIHAVRLHLKMGHRVILVVSSTIHDEVLDILAHHAPTWNGRVILGGPTRGASVVAALDALPDGEAGSGVILHNAASPNTPATLVDSCLDALSVFDGAQAYIPATHTTFVRHDDRLDWLLPRPLTGVTADPTVYRRELAEAIAAELHRVGDTETTLDVARRLGADIGLIESPASNFKITLAGDVERMAATEGPTLAR